jgi:probable F420-dependent oxidoreductase
MRFGLALPQYAFSLPDGQQIGFESTVDWARRAEELGFDSVWLSDHLFYSFARYGADPTPIAAIEPMTALAGIAALTTRVRLGTLVLCAPFRHPALLAKMAATIDRISGGRLDLGLGAGWLQEEFDAFGFPFGSVGTRFDTLEETLAALAALQSGRPATYEGPTVTLRDALLVPPPVHGRVPVWVGGKGGPRLLRLAARYADGWNAVWRIDPDDYANRVNAAHEACESVGRDPATFRLSVGLYSVVGGDEGEARALFERGRAAFPGGAMDTETWASWRADTMSGSPDQVIERVQHLESLGVEEIVVSPWVLPFTVHELSVVDVLAERVIAPLLAAR